MARLNLLHINVTILLLIGSNASATDLTIPPLNPGVAYTLATGDTLTLNQTLNGCALTLSDNTIYTISSNNTMAYIGANAITTAGGGALVNINLKPNSSLQASNTAINIANGDHSVVAIQGTVTGALIFNTPSADQTSISGGGSVIGNITGFIGSLNLNGEQPVVGTITGSASLTSSLNIGLQEFTNFALDNPLSNVPTIQVGNATMAINAAITNLNTLFTNSVGGNVRLIANLTADVASVGEIHNYGKFVIGAGGTITVIPTFKNYNGGVLTVNNANSLDLNNVINEGLMHVNAAIHPVHFTNGHTNAAQLYLNAAFTVDNPLTNGNGSNNSYIKVSNGITLTAPSLVNARNSTLEFEQDATVTIPQVVNSGNLIININNAVAPAVVFSGALDLQNGQLTVNSNLLSNTAAALAGPVNFANVITAATPMIIPKFTSNNIFGTFTPDLDAPMTHLSLTYTRTPFNQILPKNPSTITTALETMATDAAPTPEQTQLVTLVQQNAANDLEQFKRNLSKLMPMAINKSARELHRGGLKAVLVRIAELNQERTSYSASSHIENNLWFRPSYSQIKQRADLDNGLMAYRNNIYGGSLGVDTKVFNRHLVGLALNMSYSHIVDQNSSTARTKNYQGLVYGKYNFQSNVYLDWLGSIGVSSTKQRRQGLDDLEAYSKPTWIQYSLRTSLGLKMFPDSFISIEPDVSLQYTFLNNDDYTESGPSITASTVHAKNHNYLIGGGGVRVYLNFFDSGVYFSAFGRADCTLIGKQIESTVNFVNVTSPSFTTKVTTPRMLYAGGASLALEKESFKFELVFNYDFASKYRDRQYYVNLAYKF